VKPAPFDYVRAGRVEDAVAALAAANQDGDGKVIAGGGAMPCWRCGWASLASYSTSTASPAWT
jgi:hypothetical protein